MGRPERSDPPGGGSGGHLPATSYFHFIVRFCELSTMDVDYKQGVFWDLGSLAGKQY
jgi:hypothetical protein